LNGGLVFCDIPLHTDHGKLFFQMVKEVNNALAMLFEVTVSRRYVDF